MSNHFAETRCENLRYVKRGDTWFLYNEDETRWVADEKMVPWSWVKDFIVQQARTLYNEVEKAILAENPADQKDASKRAGAAANNLASKTKVAAVIDLARSHKAIATTSSRFDRDPWLLNTPGGVVQLKTEKLRPGRREASKYMFRSSSALG